MKFLILFLSIFLFNACAQKNNLNAQETIQNKSEIPIIKIIEDPRMSTIKEAVNVLPQELSDNVLLKIQKDPNKFFSLIEEAEKESKACGDLLILVDKKHYLEKDYEPEDLVSLNEYDISKSRNDLRLRKPIMNAVLEMDNAAKNNGISLLFSSSYRSYSYQEGLFQRYCNAHGEAEASRFSARAGTSQHQLGTAIDFGSISEEYAKTKAGIWLNENAWKYGFSLSFPEGMEEVTGYMWECWHFRYITKAGVQLQREYFDDIQQYFLEFLNEFRKHSN